MTHLPARPSWDCDKCGRPWPCQSAREEMADETGGGTPLAIQAWVYLEQYVRDQGDGPLAQIFERFVGWTRPIT